LLCVDDYEDCCLLYLRLCSLVDCYQGFRELATFIRLVGNISYICPGDWESRFFWKVCTCLLDYTMSHPRRQ